MFLKSSGLSLAMLSSHNVLIFVGLSICPVHDVMEEHSAQFTVKEMAEPLIVPKSLRGLLAAQPTAVLYSPVKLPCPSLMRTMIEPRWFFHFVVEPCAFVREKLVGLGGRRCFLLRLEPWTDWPQILVTARMSRATVRALNLCEF
jgi:hypothetical protein